MCEPNTFVTFNVLNVFVQIKKGFDILECVHRVKTKQFERKASNYHAQVRRKLKGTSWQFIWCMNWWVSAETSSLHYHLSDSKIQLITRQRILESLINMVIHLEERYQIISSWKIADNSFLWDDIVWYEITPGKMGSRDIVRLFLIIACSLVENLISKY